MRISSLLASRFTLLAKLFSKQNSIEVCSVYFLHVQWWQNTGNCIWNFRSYCIFLLDRIGISWPVLEKIENQDLRKSQNELAGNTTLRVSVGGRWAMAWLWAPFNSFVSMPHTLDWSNISLNTDLANKNTQGPNLIVLLALGVWTSQFVMLTFGPFSDFTSYFNVQISAVLSFRLEQNKRGYIALCLGGVSATF